MQRTTTIFTICLAAWLAAGSVWVAADEPKPPGRPPAPAAAQEGTDKPEKSDAERIIGLWKATRFYVNGQLQNLMPEDSIAVEFTVDGFKANVAVDGGTQEIDGTYFLDAKQTPKVLDAALRTSAEGQDVAAIYRLEESSLTVCFRSDGGPRPADVDQPGEMSIKVVFKRVPR
jgi:uncharacterized protein (TIGR03067 family)